MENPASNRCPECGAPDKDGKSCREQYEAMLAYEYENPESYGAAHHLTVACYNLQHPSGFTAPALAWLRSSLTAAMDAGQSSQEWLVRARAQFQGKNKVKVVRSPSEPVIGAAWSMTAADVSLGGPSEYLAGIHAWARSILADLRIRAG
jgi:hypothetical protein